MTQMSSIFSKDVSGHIEKMSFRVWHLERLSVTMEKYVSMECIDFQMILHQKASSVSLELLIGYSQGCTCAVSPALCLLFLTSVSLTQQVWVSFILS